MHEGRPGFVVRGCVIHISWKVDRDARMVPPIQAEYLRSVGATTLIMEQGASAETSLSMRSAKPGSMVVPPDSTIFLNSSLRMSSSHFMMELYVISWMPSDSMPAMAGLKSTSGTGIARCRWGSPGRRARRARMTLRGRRRTATSPSPARS